MFAALTVGDMIALAALGVFGAVVTIGGVYLVAGLFNARSLVRRELSAYFLSPIAYVMLVVFLAVTGYRFGLTLDQLTRTGTRGTDYPMQFFFSILPAGGWRFVASVDFLTAFFTNRMPPEVNQLFSGVAFWLVYLLIPPLLTMRLFAEERSAGTLEVLMTAPLRDWQMVASKYVACFAFYVILWLPTLVYLPVLLNLQQVHFAPSWTPASIAFVAGLGMIVVAVLLALPSFGTPVRLASLILLLVGLAAAVGGGWVHYHRDPAPRILEITSGGNIDPWPFVSSYLGLALLGAMFLAMGMFVSSLVRSQIVAALITVVLSLTLVILIGVPQQFSQYFGRGIVDTRYLVLYGSVALFCLFLTVRSLETRRWR